MKKNIIRAILFLIILFIILYIILYNLWLGPNPLDWFYKEPKNSADVAYYGSSSAYINFNSPLAFEKYGFSTVLLAADSEPFTLIKNLIIETRKYQNPKVYVIDILKSVDSISEYKGNSIRWTTDRMKFTKNRIDAINAGLRYIKEADTSTYFNYYFSSFIYHDSWKSYFEKENLSLYKGSRLDNTTVEIQEQERTFWDEEKLDIPEENVEALLELIDFIKENNLNVIFIVPIRIYLPERMHKLNTTVEIIENNGLEVINMNKIDELNDSIDFKNDFYNMGHMNTWGQAKYTLYFAKYLKERYNLPDHRGDELYSSYHTEYERFKADFKKLTGKEYDELLPDET